VSEKTVKRGERPLIVWTSDTGILEVAVELRRWPPIWNAASGRVVLITSRVGFRIGCLRAVIFVRKIGNKVAIHAINIHSDDTKANWTNVKVAGLSKAIKMDFEEVFVSADEAYHNRHRICVAQHQVSTCIGNSLLGTR
jgi:hypothetical protein